VPGHDQSALRRTLRHNTMHESHRTESGLNGPRSVRGVPHYKRCLSVSAPNLQLGVKVIAFIRSIAYLICSFLHRA